MLYVSVVIPMFNKENYIKRAIDSVFAQTYPYFEIIVVDDGSTDNSLNIVKQLTDKRIRIISTPHFGAAAARNKGIEAAKAELIAFLDGDDEWKPTFLETILTLVKKYPACGLYATSYEVHLPTRKILYPKLQSIPFLWEGVLPDYIENTLQDLPIISSAVVVRKQVFEQVGTFAIGEPLGEDQDMWLRISRQYPISYYHKREAIYYRGLPNSVCINLSILQPYPIFRTIKKMQQTPDDVPKHLENYLSKLYLDFVKRLLAAEELDQAYVYLKSCKANRYKGLKLQLYMVYFFKKGRTLLQSLLSPCTAKQSKNKPQKKITTKNM